MPLLYLLVMSLVQWCIVYTIYPEYPSGIFLCGNIQIITTLLVYKTIIKYVKV